MHHASGGVEPRPYALSIEGRSVGGDAVPLGCIAPPRPAGAALPPSAREVSQRSRDGGRDMPRQRRGIKLKGTFRAPARGTFALGGKSTQKRRSNLRFENPLRAFTRCLSCLFSPRERCTAEISPKCCIVSAPLFAAAFALKCRAVHPRGLWQDCFFKWRPKAATYLCRFAAKARFDNRPLPEGVSKEGGPQPSLFGRSRMGDFQGGRKIETSFPLEWRFWLLLPLLAKVTRRRQIAELPSFIKERKVSRGRQNKAYISGGVEPRPYTPSISIIYKINIPRQSRGYLFCGRSPMLPATPHAALVRSDICMGLVTSCP